MEKYWHTFLVKPFEPKTKLLCISYSTKTLVFKKKSFILEGFNVHSISETYLKWCKCQDVAFLSVVFSLLEGRYRTAY